MFSILIVDDEKLARADILYKVSRSGLDLKWVMEASSAEEAIEIVEEHKPDILITDIMMGEMSGIELIRRLRSVSNRIVSILISGHSEFKFAKEAISLGVVDYLLKPVKPKELSASLTSAVAKLVEQSNIPRFQMYQKNTAKEPLNVTQMEQLYAFLSCMEEKLDFSVATLFPQNAEYYQIGLVRLSLAHIPQKINEYDQPDFERIRKQVQDIIHEVGGHWLFCFNNFARKRQLIVIAASPEGSETEAEESLSLIFEQIRKKVYCKLKLLFHAGISSTQKTISGTMMTQARQALDLRLSMKSEANGQIYYWNRWKNRSMDNLFEEDFKLYKVLLGKGDINNALAVVRRIFSSQSPGIVLHIRILYVEMICILAHTCVKKAGGSVVSMLGPECLGGGIVDQFVNREELVESLCHSITTTMTQWMPVSADVSCVMQKVKEYIETNYTNHELSTNYLSRKFCISLGYLSATYKKTYGITISKHIISLQMEYAKELLRQTKLPIQTVAESSGYENLSYFIRTFKKNTLCTPSEYRDKSFVKC